MSFYQKLFLAEEIQKLTTLVKQMTVDNHRLTIENGLLRKASEEQRALNGRLRIELQQMDDFALGKNRS
jgi:regulator of replication initiation timing